MKRSLMKVLAVIKKPLNPVLHSEYIADIKKLLFAQTVEEAGYDKQVSKDLRKAIWPSVQFGLGTLLFGFLFFIVWGGLAPLDQAAIANGRIVLSGNHKTIQYKEGGVIREIYIQDGSRVKKDQILIELNDTDEKASVQVLGNQLLINLAIEQRIRAEQDPDPAAPLNFDQSLFDSKNPEIEKTLVAQKNLYNVRRSVINGKLGILKEKQAQFQDQISGSQTQLESTASQIKTVMSELETQKDLLKKGLALKPRVNELQSRLDELTGRKAQLETQISNLKQSIAEAELEMLNTETEFQQHVANEYKENHAQLLEIREKYNAAVDRLKRTKIKAPSDGIITDLQYFTVGGVVSPGSKILDIVPQDDTLLVEAEVNPQDIDSIHIGLLARVQLQAYKARLVPRISGEVVYISADVITERGTGKPPYYIVKVKLSQEEIRSLVADIKLYPGMPASVFIVKGERTFLQYLISPIRDSFYKAFKET